MSLHTPGKRIIVSCAVLILTFLIGFVAGGIQKTYDPEDCNNTIKEGSGAPQTEENIQ
ncbi:hypothetical protein [Cellvibrio mixtus]|uniref:hypothetical protein n=1 Tax=Cellvibrio mixtus TaxID=39650 RepID=UPI000A851EB1|nr:hypothetical protein [Cellvibrio mixtus]